MRRAWLGIVGALFVGIVVGASGCPAAHDDYPGTACMKDSDCFKGEHCMNNTICVADTADMAMQLPDLPLGSQPDLVGLGAVDMTGEDL